MLIYTSGTTGTPKGVALSHANLAANARAAAELYELDRREWAVAVLPLSHSYGLTLMNAGNLLGTRAVLLRWFNPEAVLETIQKFRATAMSGVPTMFVYLLNYPEADRFDTSSMRVWGSGAAPLPVELVEPFEAEIRRQAPGGLWAHRGRPGGVGASALRGAQAGLGGPAHSGRVRHHPGRHRSGAAGRRGGRGVRGKGPNVMLGYYRDPVETARSVRGGWLHTGDMGRLDGEGFLYIVERKKDLIIRGGFNIYPREVEEILYAFPKTAEAAVIGMPDPLMGEDVLAFVVLRHGETATADEVMAFCQTRLARYKCPKQVRFVETLPKSPIREDPAQRAPHTGVRR